MNEVIELKKPVAIIVFRRPELTRRVFDEIRKYRPPLLFVIADGARSNSVGEEKLVAETRQIFDEVDWDCQVIKIYATSNLGLRARVLSGLDEVFSQVESCIILEDDCLPSPDFFVFASQMLEHHQSHSRVALVSGNNFAPSEMLRNSYYFSTHANIWGWATWSDVWQLFRARKPSRYWTSEEIENIGTKITGLLKRREFTNLLKASNTLDSWAIGFAAHCYEQNLLSVVPGSNLVTNVGFGADSTHTKFESFADEVPAGKLMFPIEHPDEVEASGKQILRESRIKAMRWIWFPLRHPISFGGRVLRYLAIR